jgi:hypothetical protein
MKSPKMNLSSQRLTLPVLAAMALFGLPAANAESYPDTVKADNPVAYYRFEDPTNATTVIDSSASGANPGTLVFDDYGAWPQLGQAGLGSNSIAFHLYTDTFGVPEKSYVSVPYSPDLNPAGAFTTECWARATSWATENRCFLSSFQNYNAGWWFRQEAGTTPRWLYVHNGGGIYMAGGNIAKNVWTHLVVTYDGTTVRFYANGEPQWASTGTAPAPNTVGPLCIGGDPAIGNELFDGNVDEVAIYTNALTADQIKLHYAVGVTNFFIPPVAAYVVADPVPASAYAGRTATFSVNANGTTPLSYQWYKGTTPMPGATSDILSFTCAYADNGANYKVVVTNLYGSATSAPAALTVMTDLTLESSPASISRNVGSKAAFMAVTGGALPVTYQWYKGASQIQGATDQVLWLSNVQPADDQTTYHAYIANPWTNTNSDPATLMVVTRLVTVPITGYAKVVMADDPVAYWRLDEPDSSTTAVDAAGTFDGAYLPGTGSITYGVPSGIPQETNKAISVTGKGQVQVPWALELNPPGAFTAELWIQPAALNPGPDFIDVSTSEGLANNGPHGWLLYQMLDNTLTWVLFSQSWNGAWLGAGPAVEANKWYHVVLSCDGTTFHSYFNGNLVAETPYDGFVPNGDGWTSLGFRFDGGGSGFEGAIDDVAFYNKALTLDQVQAHYNATVKVGIARSGNNVILSWPFGTLQSAPAVSGTYTDILSATSPFTNAVSQTPTYYRVKVQ